MNTKIRPTYTELKAEIIDTFDLSGEDVRLEMLEELFKFNVYAEKHKYSSWFHPSITTDFGDMYVEPAIINHFQLDKREDNSHDAVIIVDGKKYKIEIKSTRCLKKKEKDETYFDRAFLYENIPGHKSRSNTIQQVKPDCYDYIIGAIVCLNEIETYLVPTSDFSFDDNKSKIKLSGQHKGNDGYEGQISFKKLEKYCLGPLSSLTLNDITNKIRQYRKGEENARLCK